MICTDTDNYVNVQSTIKKKRKKRIYNLRKGTYGCPPSSQRFQKWDKIVAGM